jgi:hypothetical protein
MPLETFIAAVVTVWFGDVDAAAAPDFFLAALRSLASIQTT